MKTINAMIDARLLKVLQRTTLLVSVSWAEATKDLPSFFNKVLQRFSITLPQRLSALVDSTGEPSHYRCEHEIIESRSLPKTKIDKISYFVTSSLPFTVSGYSVRTQGVAKGLKENGIEVLVVTRLGYPLVIGRGLVSETSAEIEGVKYRRLLPNLYPRSIRKATEKEIEKLVEVARSQQTEFLLTTTDYKNAVVASNAAFRLGIPWGYEIRGERENTWLSSRTSAESEAMRQTPYYLYASAMERAAEARAALCMVLSSIAKARLVAQGIADEKLVAIPNSIDRTSDPLCLPAKAEVRRELGIEAEGNVVIGTVSSLVDYEGLEMLVNYAAQIDDRCFVIVVGDGVARHSLEQLSKQLGVDSRVLFVGKQNPSTIESWYRSFDVFALTRKSTAVTRRVTPIKAMEALNQRVPVVASQLPAVEEATGGWAHYYEPENLASFSRAVDSALASGPPSSPDFERWLQSRTWQASTESLAKVLNKEEDDV